MRQTLVDDLASLDQSIVIPEFSDELVVEDKQTGASARYAAKAYNLKFDDSKLWGKTSLTKFAVVDGTRTIYEFSLSPPRFNRRTESTKKEKEQWCFYSAWSSGSGDIFVYSGRYCDGVDEGYKAALRSVAANQGVELNPWLLHIAFQNIDAQIRSFYHSRMGPFKNR